MAHVCRWMVSAVQTTLNKQKKKREERGGEDSGDGSMEEAGKDLCHSVLSASNLQSKASPSMEVERGTAGVQSGDKTV